MTDYVFSEHGVSKRPVNIEDVTSLRNAAGIREWAAEAPQRQEIAVEAERLTVRVGNLTINAAPADGGPVATVLGAQVLLDGKAPPLGIQGVEIVGDIRGDGIWHVKLHGFVRNPKVEVPAESWRGRKPLL
jgi:hypothetical protein